MARLATAGFEWQQLQADYGMSVNTGAPAISTATVHAPSTASCSCGNATSFTWAPVTSLTANRNYFYRVYLRISGTPSADFTLLQQTCLALAWDLRLTTSRTLQLRDKVGTNIGSASPALTANTWYRLEIKFLIPAAGNGTISARLDGVDFVTTASANLGTGVAFAALTAGDVSSTSPGITGFFDDLAFNDDQGSAQSDYPGAAGIVLLKPISDNARVGWTMGNGGTTALWDAVNNTPPVGVATGSGTATSQIRDVSGNTTDNYSANLQTYSTAGITALDLVSVCQAVAQFGPADSNNAATVGITVTSNPTDSGEVTASSAAGAPVGTTPTNWTTIVGNVVYVPTLTLGSSPVVRIGHRSNAEGAEVDALGLLVEYVINGAASPPVPDRFFRKLQAVARAANW